MEEGKKKKRGSSQERLRGRHADIKRPRFSYKLGQVIDLLKADTTTYLIYALLYIAKLHPVHDGFLCLFHPVGELECLANPTPCGMRTVSERRLFRRVQMKI